MWKTIKRISAVEAAALAHYTVKAMESEPYGSGQTAPAGCGYQRLFMSDTGWKLQIWEESCSG